MKGATWCRSGQATLLLGPWLLGSLLVYGQTPLRTYVGTEFILLRFHRDYLPPALATGVVGGLGREIWRSGTSHAVLVWGEGRLFYPLGSTVFPLSGGASLGIGWQVGLPDPERYALQLRFGLDGYTFRTDGRYSIPIRDHQLRPVVQIELSASFAELVFVRYGFYPTPGTTSKYFVALGSYF
ncbi:MAG: hypothetical protein KatS3mg026_1477 [Bacteroidia bacterium]|nr:MAG: hypothetical protein KatS3mg026_1477 [Bacteroidia bacterium]